jgi:hydroxyacylglutathione hydrolase
VALARPRCENEEYPRTVLAHDRSPLVGLEAEQLARLRVHRLVAGVDARLTLDDEDKRGFLHLMLSELLPGGERDEDDAALAVARMEHGRRTSAVGRRDRVQVPVLHQRTVPAHLPGYTRPMPVVDTFPLGPFQANCYVVRADRGAAEAAVIDPGADVAQLRLELARMGTSCSAILVTHTDVDHIGGVADLAEGTGAEVWAPAAEIDALRSGITRTGMRVRPYEPEHAVSGGDAIAVAGIDFAVIEIPGHASGHIAFFTDGCLFSGDLLFAGSVGRVDLPGGDWDALVASVRALIEANPPETVVYPGHGPATTLGAELARNPFLAELRA